MGVFRNEVVSKEFALYLEQMKTTEEWIPVLGGFFTRIAEEYRIGRVNFQMNIPKSALRPNGVELSEDLFDLGNIKESNENLHIHYITGDGGQCENYVWVRNGETWTKEEKEDLLFLMEMTQIVTSRFIITRLLNKNLSTDLMTGLYNQGGFFEQVGKLMARKPISDYYILFFNISNFKYVNRIFNNQEGDIVLTKYAALAQSKLSGEEIIGRLGGDNFVAVIHKDHLETFLNEISHLEVFHETKEIKKKFVFQATVGAAPMEGLKNNREALGRCSMAYQAARRTKQKIVFYSEELSQQVGRQQYAIIHFNEALINHEFIVYYQPKVCLEKMELCGAEALVRWKRENTMIPPMQFIPALESNGSIGRLDYYVLETVCSQLAKWRDEGRNLVTVSVNFSRKHLDDEHFVEKVVEIISRYQIAPEYIEVELTESNDYQDYEIMTSVVKEFKKNGIICSIDDFGTGYSSLNMLKNTPFDIVKIDRSFIPHTDKQEVTAKEFALFQGMMEMIKEMGMNTIAEGVEQKEQLAFLQKANCYMVQGFVFDKPLPAEEFENRLIERKYEIPEN